MASLEALKIIFYSNMEKLYVYESAARDVIPNVDDQVSVRGKRYIVKSRHFEFYGETKIIVEINLTSI